MDNGNLIRFLGIAKGSAFETEYQLLLSKDLNYITNDEYKFLMAKIQSIIRRLSNLIKFLKNQKPKTKNRKQVLNPQPETYIKELPCQLKNISIRS